MALTKSERFAKALESGAEGQARLLLNDIKKQAYNRKYYLEKQIENDKYSGLELQTARALLEKAEREYINVSKQVQTARRALKDADKINQKSVQKALNNLAHYERGKTAEKAIIREAQKSAKTVVGVSAISIKTNEKFIILMRNVFYGQNAGSMGIDEWKLREIAFEFADLTGYSIMDDFYNLFDKPQHYESGGEKGNTTPLDHLTNVAEKMQGLMLSFPKDAEERERAAALIEEFRALYKG